MCIKLYDLPTSNGKNVKTQMGNKLVEYNQHKDKWSKSFETLNASNKATKQTKENIPI